MSRQRFVFPDTRDFMRKVGAHGSIGATYEGETALDHCFILSREDRSAEFTRRPVPGRIRVLW